MITGAQMRAARALLGIDQRQLAELSGVSLPTIQRMEASEGNVRGVVDTLTKVVEAFDRAGIELIGEKQHPFCMATEIRVLREKFKEFFFIGPAQPDNFLTRVFLENFRSQRDEILSRPAFRRPTRARGDKNGVRRETGEWF